MTNNVTVVILAAGLGTRMRSTKAKVLHEAGGETLLNHVIRAALHVTAANQIVAVVGYQAEQVQDSVKAGGVRFAKQEEQRGTGHAVLCARQQVEALDGQLMILNGDGPLVTPATLRALIQQSRRAEGGSIVTTNVHDATGYGRIVRDADGMVAAIVEHKVATPEQQRITEINPGVYCFQAKHFWRHIDEVRPDNPAHEYYLTDIIAILRQHGYPVLPVLANDESELLGINTRVELSVADRILRSRKATELMLEGVTMQKPETITLDVDVQVGQDTTLDSNVQLLGQTRVGSNCKIGTGVVLRDCVVADEVTILPYVVADSSRIERGAFVGPFSRLRLNAEAGEDSHVGNFVELKKTRLGRGSKANHLAYLGDASIGAGSNIGAGTITCNYDGERKHPTTIGEKAFVGSNSTLVAPLTIAGGAYIAAGSTITKDVAADALAIGRAHQIEKEGWAKKRRAIQGKPTG